jgi:2-aminoethylphosphonate transport system substrate-binding protein
MQSSNSDVEKGQTGRSTKTRRAVTLYSVNGLYEDPTNWLGKILPKFISETGIEVDYAEDHSRTIVKRATDEGLVPRPDVLITLSPFIQMAAKSGWLAPHCPKGKEGVAGGMGDEYHQLIRNYPNLICHTTPSGSVPASYNDLLLPRYKGKIQYSKPGWSGAGTAFLLQVYRAFGSKKEGLEYLRQLQQNCLRPSSHTQGLAARVNDGELLVANGDVQTNYPQCTEYPNLQLVIPIAPDGNRYVYEFSYYVALLKDAANSEHGKALIDFLYSEYAQSMVSDIAHGLPGRRNINASGETHRKLTALLEGVVYWVPNWGDIIDTLDDDIKLYETIVLGTQEVRPGRSDLS